MNNQQFRRNRLPLLADLVLVVGFAAVFCFLHLGQPSFGRGDETIYVRSAQGMAESGDWTTSRIDGQAFHGKPPMAMWMMLASSSLLGESTFSYRVPAALSGVLTAVLLYLFAQALFSRRVGFVAVGALFGCHAWVTNHGPRMAVLDAPLLLLITGAMLCAWKLFAAIEQRSVLDISDPSTELRREARRWSIAGGVLVGLAVLTKSAAGVLPLTISAVYALLAGLLPVVWRHWRATALLVVALAVAVPAPYMLSHCFFTAGACQSLLGVEVVERATQGFHNIDNPWFYLQRIFSHRATLPPYVLSVALLFAVWIAATRRDKKLLFVACWAVVPVVFYSVIPSRLTWYIAPAYPAMAVLIGVLLDRLTTYATQSWRDWVGGMRRFSWTLVPAGVGMLAIAAVLGYHLAIVWLTINKSAPSYEIEQFTKAIQHNASDQTVLATYYRGSVAWNERAYMHMLSPYRKRVGSLEQLVEAAGDNAQAYALTTRDQLIPLHRQRPVTGYAFLRPMFDRHQWFAAATYRETPAPFFTPASQKISFGSDDFQPMRGWEGPGTHNESPVRLMRGPRAAFLLLGDDVMRTLGSHGAIKLAYLPGKQHSRQGLRVEFFLNDTSVTSFAPTPNGFSVHHFQIPAGAWEDGLNSLQLSAEFADGAEFGPSEKLLMFDWMTLHLGSKQG